MKNVLTCRHNRTCVLQLSQLLNSYNGWTKCLESPGSVFVVYYIKHNTKQYSLWIDGLLLCAKVPYKQNTAVCTVQRNIIPTPCWIHFKASHLHQRQPTCRSYCQGCRYVTVLWLHSYKQCLKKTQYFKVHSNHQFPSPIQRSLCQPSQLLSPGSAISDGTPLWSKRAEICVRFIVWWFMRIQQSLFLFLVFKKGTAAYCEIRWWCNGIHMKKIKSSKLQYQKQYNYKHN